MVNMRRIMALFDLAFIKTLKAEGGYLLHTVPGDKGGQTYAGISRVFWPDWPGWAMIDAGDINSMRLEAAVKHLYEVNFWNKVGGEAIAHQAVAETLFDFAVNAGVTVAVKTAQEIIGVARDGKVGPATLVAINKMDPVRFAAEYRLARVRFRLSICMRDKSQTKFLLGWITRDVGA